MTARVVEASLSRMMALEERQGMVFNYRITEIDIMDTGLRTSNPVMLCGRFI